MSEYRYTMRSKAGHYVEAKSQAELVKLREDRKDIFKHARIIPVLQSWAEVIIPMTIYPPEVETRRDFRKFNQ